MNSTRFLSRLRLVIRPTAAAPVPLPLALPLLDVAGGFVELNVMRLYASPRLSEGLHVFLPLLKPPSRCLFARLGNRHHLIE